MMHMTSVLQINLEVPQPHKKSPTKSPLKLSPSFKIDENSMVTTPNNITGKSLTAKID
jgi:hypothetical protein